MNLTERFEIKLKLGEGSFSKIYKAYDNLLKREVALKMEKEDKLKKILKFEYELLKRLQGLNQVPRVFDYINQDNICEGNSKIASNFIVMESLGKNIANFKKTKSKVNSISNYEILLQMLSAIEGVHNIGIIHRDIKPSNFVIDEKEEKIYIVDFGLAKIHLDRNKNPLPPRKETDFRGTLVYASLNAHNKKELSRRDDMWSFFFVILDLLDESLPWRHFRDEKNEIEKMKEDCLKDPMNKLLQRSQKGKQLFKIFNHINSLEYEEKPNYSLIRDLLVEMQELSGEIPKLNNMIKPAPEKNSQLLSFPVLSLDTPINEYRNFKNSTCKIESETELKKENNKFTENNNSIVIRGKFDPSVEYLSNFLKNYTSEDKSHLYTPVSRNNIETFLKGKRYRDVNKESRERTSTANLDKIPEIKREGNSNNSSLSSKNNNLPHRTSDEFLKCIFTKLETGTNIKSDQPLKNILKKGENTPRLHFYDSLSLDIEKNLITYMMKNMDAIRHLSKSN